MKKLLILTLLLCFSTNLFAEKLPWDKEKYTHYSEEQPLKEMLEEMAASQETSIVVSPKVTDVISAYYKQMYPIDILKSLAKSNDLLWYYDGKVLYIYKNDEIQTGSVTLKRLSVKQFSQALRKIGILDDQFYWNEVESEGIVYFKGPERFVSAVLQMSEILDNKKPNNDKVFKWVSKSGRVHYSNINPEKGGASIGSKVHILTKDNLYLDN